jgi:hypothetical protein
MWHEVRNELRAFKGMMIFVASRWDLQWSNVVYSVDASLSGYGIVKSKWSLADVRRVGRVDERSRYKLGATIARSSALHLAGFVLDEEGNLVKSGNSYLRVPADLMQDINAQRWEANLELPEVPPALLQGHKWQSVMADKWKFSDNIMILEARAMVKTAERVSSSRAVSDLRVLIFGDNLGVVLAFGRRRARKSELLIHIRGLVSLGLARGIRFYCRWVPSEFNSADFGSRLFDENTKI